MKIPDIVAHLIQHGWAIFNIPSITPHVEPILTNFNKLLACEEEFKAKLKIHIPELSNKADHGLIPPKGEGFDQKEMLMWRRNLHKMWLNGRITGKEFEPHIPLFQHMNNVYKIGQQHILQIAAEFDRQDPGFYFYNHLNKSRLLEETNVLRLPKYIYDPAAPDRLYSAQPHVDLSAITLQLFETAPGLFVEGFDGELINYEYDPSLGTVIIFIGDKFEQLTLGKYTARPHGVLALAKDHRYSLMEFFHTEHPTRERDNSHLKMNETKVITLKEQIYQAA